MKRKVLMFDVDGVLVDFVSGFTKLAGRVNAGVSPEIFQSSTLTHPTWGFEDYMTKKQSNETWKHLVKNPERWLHFAALDVDFNRINRISHQHQTYFVTSRDLSSWKYTKLWLFDHGITSPNVVMTKNKGEFADLAGVTHAIDDKLDHAYNVGDHIKHSYLIDRPYNSADTYPEPALPYKRIKYVTEYLDVVEGG